MAGNRNAGADARAKLIHEATPAILRSASLSEKARVVLHLWMIAALLTLVVKVALS